MATTATTQPSGITAEEQAKIDAAVKEYQEKAKQDVIDAVIRNAVLDAERKQPGRTGF